MPTVTETRVKAYGFCLNAQCPGYLQEEVDAIRTETVQTYLDNGGDLPGVDRSSLMVRFADESERPCASCGNPREVSEQERPEYANISGHDPMGLFEFRGKTTRELMEIRHAQELADARKETENLKRDQELADLRRQLEDVTAALAQKANKTGPKPNAG